MTEPKKEPGNLVSEFADDPDMVELVEMFVQELPDKLAHIEKALAEQDISTIATLSHQLKGSAGGYGFPSLTDAAKTLETSAKTQQDIAELTAAFHGLADLCARVRVS